MCKKIIVAILIACMMLSLAGCDDILDGQNVCDCGCCEYDAQWEEDDRYYDYERWDRL